jgi:hypothetical protein
LPWHLPLLTEPSTQLERVRYSSLSCGRPSAAIANARFHRGSTPVAEARAATALNVLATCLFPDNHETPWAGLAAICCPIFNIISLGFNAFGCFQKNNQTPTEIRTAEIAVSLKIGFVKDSLEVLIHKSILTTEVGTFDVPCTIVDP